MKKVLWILSLSLLIFAACGKKDSVKADDKSASTGNVELVFWHGIESPDSVAILESKIKESMREDRFTLICDRIFESIEEAEESAYKNLEHCSRFFIIYIVLS